MARLLTTGAEWNNAAADQVTLNGSVSTTQVRTGTYSYTVTDGLSNFFSFSGVVGTSYYGRTYLYLPSLPGSEQAIATFEGAGPISYAAVKCDSGGTLRFYDKAISGSLLGTAAAPVSAGQWFRLEIFANIGVGASDAMEARLEGVPFGASSGLSVSEQPPIRFDFGVSPGAGVIVYSDDIALNDSSGASQTSWPGSGKIVLLRPIALNANGGSWTDDQAATTSAALTAAIDNTPPKGIADTTTGGGDHQVRNANANSSLDMDLTTYASAGIRATDTINVVVPAVNVGAPVSTGAKSGSFGTTTNPTIANRAFTGGSGTATFFWRGAAAGTYPSNWGWEIGTVTYAPAVTVANSPVGRLTITGGTTTRIAMCDAMGLYVDFTPAGALPFLPFRQAATIYKI